MMNKMSSENILKPNCISWISTLIVCLSYIMLCECYVMCMYDAVRCCMWMRLNRSCELLNVISYLFITTFSLHMNVQSSFYSLILFLSRVHLHLLPFHWYNNLHFINTLFPISYTIKPLGFIQLPNNSIWYLKFIFLKKLFRFLLWNPRNSSTNT